MTTMISDEPEFIAQYLSSLSSRSVRYGLNHTPFRTPTKKLLKRQPPSKSRVHPVEKPAVDDKHTTGQSNTNAPSSTIKVTVKTLKPASQFEIFNLQPTDTIATLKDRISQQRSIPIKLQRLLIKGKVLNDTKPLAEYAIAEGTVVHLMIKASTTSTPEPTPVDAPVDTPSVPLVTVGEHGVSQAAENTIKQAEFWKKIDNVLKETLSQEDAQTILKRFLQLENWTGITYEQL